MDEELDELEKLQKEVLELLTQVDMTTELFYEVVERTQNFREGFYSYRRINDLYNTASRMLETGLHEATTDEEQVAVMEEFVQNSRNVLATTMTEIDRIDSS